MPEVEGIISDLRTDLMELNSRQPEGLRLAASCIESILALPIHHVSALINLLYYLWSP